MSETKHAVLSPSSSSRWMACPGSVVLEAGEPNSDNEYSREGTLAHAVAAHCLQKNINADKIMFFDLPGRDGKPKTEIVSAEMRGYVNEYLDFMREKAKGHVLLVEQGLDISWLTGEEGATGTGDSVIISNDAETLSIVDLKYGFNEVPAANNPQTRIYGLAAAEVFSAFGNFKKFELGIFQPRIGNIDSETLTLEEMQTFEAEVRAAVKRVEEAKKSNSLDGFLETGPHCKYCRAASKCPKLTQELVEATGADFQDETQSELIEPVDLSKAGAKLALIEGWLRAVRAKIEAELFSGRPVKGWKLVQGKQGNREFVDEDDAKKQLEKAGVAKEDMTETKMLSVAKLEKKIKGNEKALELLPSLYTRKDGKPGVAPLSDKRPPYTLRPEEDFSEVE